MSECTCERRGSLTPGCPEHLPKDTPRTNANILENDWYAELEWETDPEFSRQLERELYAMTAERDAARLSALRQAWEIAKEYDVCSVEVDKIVRRITALILKEEER